MTKLVLILLVLCTFTSYIRSADEPEQTSCVFLGCTCGDAPDPNGDYEEEDQGSDIRCKFDENVSGQQQQAAQAVDFPRRVESGRKISTITSLDMSSVGLVNVPADHFTGLTISVADLSKNSISSISEHAFRGLEKLDVLELSYNQINDIKDGTFTSIEAVLIQLTLKHNKLSAMNPKRFSSIFSRLSNLRSLYIDSNGFTALPNLSKMAKLEDVSISYNQLESLIDAATGEQLLPSTVLDLQLGNNRFKHLTRKTFENLKNLKYLYLEGNQISAIDNDAFAHLTRLNSLFLSKNFIKHIPSKAFFTLISLERLDLASQNQMLREIDDFAFDRQLNAVAIRKIDLSKNRITKLSNKAFCSKNRTHPYANVKDLDLASNQLSGINACVLRQMSKGYDEFKNAKQSAQHNHQQKSRVNFKPTSLVDKLGPNLKCDCDVTKSAHFVDLDGECENSAGVLVPLGQFKCNSDIQFNVEYVEAECVAKKEYNCLELSSESDKGGSGSGGSNRQPVVVDNSSNNNRDKVNQVTKLPNSSGDGNGMGNSANTVNTRVFTTLVLIFVLLIS